MRYELAHDTLARQILDRVSAEAKARRQAALLVERAYARYQERGVLLQKEDLEEIRPHEAAIPFSAEETAFIARSKDAIERAARRRRQIVIAIISLLSVFLLFALWQWQRASASARAQRQVRLALQSQAAYERGEPSLAFRLSQEAADMGNMESGTEATITDVLSSMSTAGLERDLMHDQPVQQLRVHPQRPYLMGITTGNTATVWDLQGHALHQLTHDEPLAGGDFVPWEEEGMVISYTTDGAVHIWDQNGKQLQRQETGFPIRGIDLNAKYKLLLIWGQEELKLMDTRGKTWDIPQPSTSILSAEFSPNGTDLLLVTPDSVSSWWLELVRIGKAQPRFTIRDSIQRASYIRSDHKQLQVLVQSANGRSRVYDASGELDNSSYYQYLNRELAALPPVRQFVFSYPGTDHPKTLMLNDSSAVRYWSAYREHADRDRAGNLDMYTRTTTAITGIAFSPTDRFLLTASADGWVNIWDISQENIENYRKFKARISQAYFMESDRYLVTTAGDHSIKIWRLTDAPIVPIADAFTFYDPRLRPLTENERAIYLHF